MHSSGSSDSHLERHVIHDRNVILLVALSGVKVHRSFVSEFTVGIDSKSLRFFTMNVSWLSTDHDVQNTYHVWPTRKVIHAMVFHSFISFKQGCRRPLMAPSRSIYILIGNQETAHGNLDTIVTGIDSGGNISVQYTMA